MTSEPPDIAVVILTINQKEKTLRCLESFQAVKTPAYRIYLWDNGSNDGTLEAVGRQYPDVVCHGSSENLGVASGRNAASKLAISDFDPAFLFFIDNDMIVSPDFLSVLAAPFAEDPTLALTTGKLACLGEDGRPRPGPSALIYGAGGCKVSFWRGDTSHIGYGELDRGQYDKSGECIVSGGCMLVRSSVFQELNGFDPVYDPYGPEDLDFGLRAREKGYHGRYEPAALVWHDMRPGRSSRQGNTAKDMRRTGHGPGFCSCGGMPLRSRNWGSMSWAALIACFILFARRPQGQLLAAEGIAAGLHQRPRSLRVRNPTVTYAFTERPPGWVAKLASARRFGTFSRQQTG